MEIINVTAAVNRGYNPATANNGGGYFQPSGTVTVQTARGIATIDVDDTSCGDFGSRIAILVRAAGCVITLCLGSMESDPDDVIDGCLEAIAEMTGEDPTALVDTAIDAVRGEAYRVWCNRVSRA